MSAIPPSPTDRQRTPDNLTLMAVNDTPIRTYGKRSLTLNLGLRRSLPWIFIIADVQKPILGADFLRHFGLLVDVQKRQLVDTHCTFRVSSPVSPLLARPSVPRILPTLISLSWRSSLLSRKSAHQTHPASTMSHTTLRPPALQPQPVPDVSLQTAYVPPSRSLNTCFSLVSVKDATSPRHSKTREQGTGR